MSLFGTDGIRGKANSYPMTADMALKVGKAAGQQFRRGNHRHKVVIAKDTRLSGYMVEPALTAGFISVGMDVVLAGPLPTPAVAMMVKSLRADLGVMISASHNAYHDNGIKLFGPDGYKLSDDIEASIESLIENEDQITLAEPEKLGKAKRLDNSRGRYIELAKATFPKNLTLEGVKVVIDCAHGAGYFVAPNILSELGADVVAMGVEPNGFNINVECGSTATDTMCRRVVAEKADIGIALDGDADRLIVCDEKGVIANGDQLLALIASQAKATHTIRGGGIVATQMSNMGLEQYLATLDLTLERTKVGDRYVVERMREGGFNIGGEQSGHIILSDHTTTGDGIIAALQILALLVAQQKPMSEAAHCFTPMPQLLQNVRYEGASPLGDSKVQAAIAASETELASKGRVFIRKSGTEPLIRVMIEGEDAALIKQHADRICDALEAAKNNA